MNEQRLRNVVRALRESPAPDDFTMRCYIHDCGTPACAIGHYAVRNDLQDDFRVRSYKQISFGGSYIFDRSKAGPARHFGVTVDEYYELFDDFGCGCAETVEEAATYIEDFITRKNAVQEVTAPRKESGVTV